VADLGTKDGFGLIIGSPHQSLEEMHLLKLLAGDSPVHGGLAGADRSEKDALLLDADRTPNRKGLTLMGIDQGDGAVLAATIKGVSGPVLIHGGDPAADPAVAESLGAKSVVYLGTHNNATAALAAVVLPGAMWAEKAGIFINRDGRLQEFKQSVARHGNAREDWRILAELMKVTGKESAPGSLKAVRTELNAVIDGDADLNKLPERGFVPGGEVR
jgi:NADH-quinone oxidoreductase subunit G